MIYSAQQKGPYKVSGYHDPDSLKYFGIIFKPLAWAAATVYYKRSDDDYDVVIPTVFTGLYHKVINPGKSHATVEPTWATVEGDETTDANGLVFKAVNYNLMVPSENISSVTVTASDDIVITSVTNTTSSCQFMINPLTAAAVTNGYFEVYIHYVKSNTEEDDITLRFRIHDR